MPLFEYLFCRLAVDSYEYADVPAVLSAGELTGELYKGRNTEGGEDLFAVDGTTVQQAQRATVEYKPHFYEWATAYSGMIAVQRKQRSNFRHQTAAETAAPVIVCAAGKGKMDEFDWQFAGVVRSNSVRTVDDGMGPTVDELFTLTIEGPQTILNNSKRVIHPGDYLSWTFYSEDSNKTGVEGAIRAKSGSPRRIGIRVAEFHDECVIGKALTFAKPGQILDILVKQ